MRTLLGLLIILAPGLARAQTAYPLHVAVFHRADPTVALPLLDAWEGFLRSEKAGIVFAENIRARTNEAVYEFAPGGVVASTTTEALETAGGFFLLLPPDPKRLARFEAYASRPYAYPDGRAPRLRRRPVRLFERDGKLAMALADAGGEGQPEWSDRMALVYALEGGARGVFLYKTMGGLGRVASAVDRLRTTYGKPLLVLSRGDAIDRLGLPGVEPIRALERLGVRAVAVGAGELARLGDIAAYKASASSVTGVAFLSANVSGSTIPALALEGSRVFTVEGLRVGVLGLTQPEGESLLSAKNAGYSVSDPVVAARGVVTSLRGQADIVIALTNLSPAENARLRERVPGIDVIMGDELPVDAESAVPEAVVETVDRGVYDPALLITSDAPATLTHLTARYRAGAQGRYALSLREERVKLDESLPDLSGYARFHYEAYGVDVGSQPAVLPAARRLYTTGQGAPRLKDVDFWRLAASLVAERAGAEVAFLPIQPVENRTTGDVQEEVARSWFAVPDRVVVAQLPADAVRALLAETHKPPSEAPGSGAGLRLAAGGLGPGDTMNGVSVDFRSTYRVAVTERMLARAGQFPALSQAENKRDLGPLDELVLGSLRQAASEGWTAERYRPLLEGRPVRERGLWRVDFRDVSLRVTNNKLVTDPRLANVSEGRAHGFDQFSIGSALHAEAEYLRGAFRWKSGTDIEYTSSRLHPPNQSVIVNTPNNRLDGHTGISDQVGSFPLSWLANSYGPSLGLEYEGQVERLPYMRREQKLNLLPGVELSGGRYLQTLELAGTLQRDFTPTPSVPQYGARLRVLASHRMGKGQVSAEVLTRYYVLTHHDSDQDLRLSGNLVIRLMVPLTKRVTVAPYFDYFYFKHKIDPASGYSIMTGVSFAFTRLWKPAYEPF